MATGTGAWQITPRVLLEATTDPDRAAAQRAFWRIGVDRRLK
jgi:hypothetical protein